MSPSGRSPSGPQSGAKTQRLGAFFKAPPQLLQLDRLQARFATGPTGSIKRLDALLSPGLVPTTDRLSMHIEFAGHLSLAQTFIKEFGGFEQPMVQLLKIAFDALCITRAQRLASKSTTVTILYEVM